MRARNGRRRCDSAQSPCIALHSKAAPRSHTQSLMLAPSLLRSFRRIAIDSEIPSLRRLTLKSCNMWCGMDAKERPSLACTRPTAPASHCFIGGSATNSWRPSIDCLAERASTIESTTRPQGSTARRTRKAPGSHQVRQNLLNGLPPPPASRPE